MSQKFHLKKYENIHCGQKLETIQLFIYWQIYKQILISQQWNTNE